MTLGVQDHSLNGLWVIRKGRSFTWLVPNIVPCGAWDAAVQSPCSVSVASLTWFQQNLFKRPRDPQSL